MTFRQIIDDAVEILGNTDPGARVRYRRFLNEWHRRILTEVALPRVVTGATLSVVANTKEYTLPVAVSRVRSIFDKTNNRMLVERTLSWIRSQDPMETQTGTPEFFAQVTPTSIRLFPIPSANNTLYIDHEAVVSDLDDDADVPIIPADFHYLLSLGIQINEHRKNKDYASVKDCREELAHGIGALRYYIAGRLTNVLNPGDGHAAATSQLGGWYPRGS